MQHPTGSGGPVFLLLNDTGEEANWGCRATSFAMRSLLARAYPDAVVRPVSLRPLHHAPRLLRRWLDRHAAALLTGGGRVVPFAAPLERWVERQLFAGVDPRKVVRVVLNGEGTTHGFRGQTLRVLLPFHLAQSRHSIWTAAVNQTVALDGDASRSLFRTAYGRANYLAVREPRSHRELIDLGLPDVRLAADAAFHLEPAAGDEVASVLQAHGLTDGFIAISGSATVESYPLAAHRELVRQLHARWGGPIVVLAATNADRRRVGDLASSAPLVTLPASLSPELVAGILGRSRFFIAGRFHLLIFAALAGAPFVPLASNSFKIEGLLESLRYPIPVSGPADTVETILDRATTVDRERDALSELLRSSIAPMRERALINVAFPE